MLGQVIHVLSDVRSGSTILSQLLGAHSKIASIGELQWLKAYVLDDRRYYDPPHALVCACGKAFQDCEFWHAVRDEVTRPLQSLEVMPRFFGWADPRKSEPLVQRSFRRLVTQSPRLSHNRVVQAIYGARGVVDDSFEVYDAILRQTRASYVVDTSKNIFRAQLLYQGRRERMKLIALRRDFRAIVYAKMKRGRTLRNAATSWASKARQIADLTQLASDGGVLVVNYEDLCGNIAAELERIARFLQIDIESDMQTRPSHNVHDLGGSPSKFQAERREIRLDNEYLNALSSIQLDEINSVVGDVAEVLGYRLRPTQFGRDSTSRSRSDVA